MKFSMKDNDTSFNVYEDGLEFRLYEISDAKAVISYGEGADRNSMEIRAQRTDNEIKVTMEKEDFPVKLVLVNMVAKSISDGNMEVAGNNTVITGNFKECTITLTK